MYKHTKYIWWVPYRTWATEKNLSDCMKYFCHSNENRSWIYQRQTSYIDLLLLNDRSESAQHSCSDSKGAWWRECILQLHFSWRVHHWRSSKESTSHWCSIQVCIMWQWSFICLLCVLLKGRGEVRNTEKLFRYRLRLKDFICISPENGYPLGVFSILSFYVYHIVQAQVHVVLMVNLFWSNSTSHG